MKLKLTKLIAIMLLATTGIPMLNAMTKEKNDRKPSVLGPLGSSAREGRKEQLEKEKEKRHETIAKAKEKREETREENVDIEIDNASNTPFVASLSEGKTLLESKSIQPHTLAQKFSNKSQPRTDYTITIAAVGMNPKSYTLRRTSPDIEPPHIGKSGFPSITLQFDGNTLSFKKAYRVDEKNISIKEIVAVKREASEIRTDIVKAVNDGNNNKIVSLITTEGANPNERDNNDLTLLTIAVQKGRLETMRVLLDNNANPTIQSGPLAKDQKDRTPLLTAIAGKKDAKIIELLLDKKYVSNEAARKVYVDQIDPITKETPLYSVVKLNLAADQAISIINLLNGFGADVNRGKKTDSITETPIYAAATSNDVRIIEILLNLGADINLGKSEGTVIYTPFNVSLSNRGDAQSLFLIAKDADINLASNGIPPLIATIQRNKTTVLDALLNSPKLEISASYKGKNALFYATCFLTDGSYLEKLVAKGLDANSTDNEGNTLLSYANSAGVTKTLIATFNIDPTKKNNQGVTPLMFAAVKDNNRDVIIELLKNAQTAGQVDNKGNNALIYNAYYGAKVYEELLQQTDLMTQNIDGNTALIAAADKKNVGKVKQLVVAASNKYGGMNAPLFKVFINQNNKDDYTALNYVLGTTKGDTDTAKYLTDNGALRTKQQGGAKAGISLPRLTPPSCASVR